MAGGSSPVLTISQSADPAHLLEAIAVIVYDPNTGLIRDDLPPGDLELRWDDFVRIMADTYDVRFED